MARRRQEAADDAAMKASEAGRVLRAQRDAAQEPEQVEPVVQSDEDAPTPEPRNEPRRLAMEEIERRDLQTKGIAEPPVEEPPAEPAATEPAAEAPPEAAPPEAPPEAPQVVRVKVDGQEFDVPKADVDAAGGVNAYQRERASENRLKKTNEALAEARRAQAALVQMIQKQQPPQQTPDQFLASKIDVIRYGSPEESAQALREVIERSNPRIDQNAITQQAVNKMQQTIAVSEFQKEFADVVGTPLALKLATTLETERLAQMEKAGHTPVWSGFYRQIGNEVRSVIGKPSQPATTTGNPSPVPSDKEARKASIVNLPTAAARAAPPAESKPETRDDILREMRKSRGIPTG